MNWIDRLEQRVGLRPAEMSPEAERAAVDASAAATREAHQILSHFAGDDSPSARRVIAAAQAVIDGDRAIRTAIAEREAGLS